jgi:hypothetical protein
MEAAIIQEHKYESHFLHQIAQGYLWVGLF